MKLIVISILVIFSNYVYGSHYELKKNNKTCISVNTDAQFTMNDTKYNLQPVRKNNVRGYCNPPNGTNSSIVLPLGKKRNKLIGFVYFNFTMNPKTKGVSLSLSIKLNDNNKPINIGENIQMGNSSQYFSCNRGVDFQVKKMMFKLYHTKIQAFNMTNGKFSKKKFTCHGDVVSTVKPQTTSVKPSPLPFVPTFYVKKNGTGIVCALAQFNAQFVVNYLDKKKKKMRKNIDLDFHGTRAQQVDGKCDNFNTVMNILFHKTWKLVLNFTRTSIDKSAQYKLFSVALKYVADNKTFPNTAKNGSETANSSSLNFLLAKSDGHYACESMKSVTLKPKLVYSIELKMTNVQMEMFRAVNKSLKFDGKEHNCKSNTNTTVVPIVVGVVLSLLVLIVLIVYLVGRRRRIAAAGYQSI